MIQYIIINQFKSKDKSKIMCWNCRAQFNTEWQTGQLIDIGGL